MLQVNTRVPVEQRLLWVDVLKGLGIAAVVAGHIFSGLTYRALFLFHMPLFFFISGYLFRPDANGRSLAAKKAVQLLVPYAAFIALLGLPILIIAAVDGSFLRAAARMVIGGRLLTGAMGVFWFVTCLYATLVVGNHLLGRQGKLRVWTTVLVCIVLSYANSLLTPAVWLPLNLNVVLAALPFFVFGYFVRRFGYTTRVTILAAFGVLVAVAMLNIGVHVEYDMKYAVYGIPGLSMFLAASCILISCEISKVLASQPTFAKPLARLGQLSLGVMFVHQPFNFALIALAPELSKIVVFACVLLVSFATSILLDQRQWTRRLFLGFSASPNRLSKRPEQLAAAA